MTMWQGIGFAVVALIIILELAQIMGTLLEISENLEQLTKHHREDIHK